jgi:NAD(P)H-hydrate epimerase
LCGAIEVVDIGLGDAALIADGAPTMLDALAARAAIPPIGANAHKGTRGRVAIVGGAEGMAGAAVFAARGALRAGAGLVRVVVAPASLAAMQAAVPEATGAVWPTDASQVRDTLGGANAVVVGPGLGAANRVLVDMVVAGCAAPVVLDADALNAYAGAASALKAAIITPHAAECARLMGVTTADVLRGRFDIGLALARACGAVVVLKGTPTVVSAPDGRVVVAPVGSPVLATGGSGDVLAGVAGALLATIHDPMQAALSAVWAHGAAAEYVATSRVRGATLADVVDALRDVWHTEPGPLDEGVLAHLPAVGER